jgi:hypothetical protein
VSLDLILIWPLNNLLSISRLNSIWPIELIEILRSIWVNGIPIISQIHFLWRNFCAFTDEHQCIHQKKACEETMLSYSHIFSALLFPWSRQTQRNHCDLLGLERCKNYNLLSRTFLLTWKSLHFYLHRLTPARWNWISPCDFLVLNVLVRQDVPWQLPPILPGAGPFWSLRTPKRRAEGINLISLWIRPTHFPTSSSWAWGPRKHCTHSPWPRKKQFDWIYHCGTESCQRWWTFRPADVASRSANVWNEKTKQILLILLRHFSWV